MKAVRYTVSLLGLLLASNAWAYGEPDTNGSPNHRERLLHVFTNQVRQAPHEWPGWDTSLATGNARDAVALSPGLLAAARFHATDMATNGCFSHESCDGTDTFTRIRRYFDGPAGENIYYSQGDASVRRAITGWMTSDGHRRNILTGDWTVLGTGFSGAGREVYMVQNFGGGSNAAVPLIPGGAVENKGATYQLMANYFDPGRAPQEFVAVLDGERIPLVREVGRDGNETLSAEVPAADECVALTFEAVSADGERYVFPTTGEILVGRGCTSEFRGKRTPVVVDDQQFIDANDEAGGCTCTAPRTLGGAWLVVLIAGLSLVRRNRR